MTDDNTIEKRITNKYGLAIVIVGLIIGIWIQNIEIAYKVGGTLIGLFVYFLLVLNEKLNIIDEKIDNLRKDK